jgi:hypothetical protein
MNKGQTITENPKDYIAGWGEIRGLDYDDAIDGILGNWAELRKLEQLEKKEKLEGKSVDEKRLKWLESLRQFHHNTAPLRWVIYRRKIMIALPLPFYRIPEESKRLKQFFKTIELAAFLIPAKTRKECFEPFFEEAKEDYLKMRRKNKGRVARRWLALCFSLHASLIVAQSLWALCSEKTKKAVWTAFGGFVMWIRGH